METDGSVMRVRGVQENSPTVPGPLMSLDETDIFNCDACPVHGGLLNWSEGCMPAACGKPHGQTEGFWTAIENADGWRKVVCTEHSDAIRIFLNYMDKINRKLPDGN